MRRGEKEEWRHASTCWDDGRAPRREADRTKLRDLQARWRLCRWCAIVLLRSWPGTWCECREKVVVATYRQRSGCRHGEGWEAGVGNGYGAAPVRLEGFGGKRRFQGYPHKIGSVAYERGSIQDASRAGRQKSTSEGNVKERKEGGAFEV